MDVKIVLTHDPINGWRCWMKMNPMLTCDEPYEC